MSAPFEIVRLPDVPGVETFGELLIEGEHFCNTLELPWLNNVRDKSCIPCGTYEVILSYSTRFRREMPRFIGVPGRTGILIHSGDTEEDTEGCVLVGDGETPEAFEESNSREVLKHFLEWFASNGNEAQVSIRYQTPAVPVAA